MLDSTFVSCLPGTRSAYPGRRMISQCSSTKVPWTSPPTPMDLIPRQLRGNVGPGAGPVEDELAEGPGPGGSCTSASPGSSSPGGGPIEDELAAWPCPGGACTSTSPGSSSPGGGPIEDELAEGRPRPGSLPKRCSNMFLKIAISASHVRLELRSDGSGASQWSSRGTSNSRYVPSRTLALLRAMRSQSTGPWLRFTLVARVSLGAMSRAGGPDAGTTSPADCEGQEVRVQGARNPSLSKNGSK